MNRQIKFRVWNKARNQWVHGPGKEVNLFGESILLGGFMTSVLFEELNDCVAQQFTGLLDKNGKEIYEGDIVKFSSGYPNQDDTLVERVEAVEFNDGAFWPRPIYENNDDEPWYDYELKDLEVIGNIFENPELLFAENQ